MSLWSKWLAMVVVSMHNAPHVLEVWLIANGFSIACTYQEISILSSVPFLGI